MKSISTVIAIILILMIVVAIASLALMFLTNMFSTVTQTGTASMQHVIDVMSSCMRISFLYQNKIYLRNCGQGAITNDSLNIYIDDVPFTFNMTPSSINANEIATIAMPVWGISVGDHKLRITNPGTEVSEIITSSLPGSCVLDLEFDEGSGTIAHDSSGNGNGGALYSSAAVCSDPPTAGCPRWVDGKFGKALSFDGINDYVDSGNDSSLNTASFSASMWLNLASDPNCSTDNNWRSIIRKGDIAGTVTGWDVDLEDDKTLYFDIGNGTTPMQNRLYDWSYKIPVGQWTFVTFVYDANSDDQRIYINGTSNVNQIFNGQFINSTEPLTISYGTKAFECPNGGGFFNGTIDSVRIYNKALTPDETVNLKLK